MEPLHPAAGGSPTAAHPDYPVDAGRLRTVGTPEPGRDARAGGMRVVLRADAGRTQGTGHVMRLLTLAEALHEHGHHPVLATAEIDVPWLAGAVRGAGVPTAPATRDRIRLDEVTALEPDWVVVDSYLVPSASITALDEVVPVLLLADGDARAATATLYLDQNLDAPPLPGIPVDRQLRGAAYALVRRAVRDRAPADPVPLRHDPPEIVVVLGGTDPDDRTVDVAAACARLDGAAFTFIAPQRQHDALRRIGAGRPGWRVLPHTPDLPALLAAADVAVSAGGTSAWDLGTLAVPAILLAVVPNQQASLAAIDRAGVALGFDLVAHPDAAPVAGAVRRLLDDPGLRARLVEASRRTFDGHGAERVVAELRAHPRTRHRQAGP